jgi:hypothetical protein
VSPLWNWLRSKCQADKIAHALAGWVAVDASLVLAAWAMGTASPWAPVAASAVLALVATGKELVDRRPGGTGFDGLDLFATICGGAAALAFHALLGVIH